jgi:hypothetical protein
MNGCWGCRKFEATNLPGFVQADCISCEARVIATSDEARSREADPHALTALMHRQWPERERFLRGRPLVWEHIKKQGVKEMT